MALYVLLMNLTDQGVKTVKKAPGRIQSSMKALEAMGGKVIAFYATMGDYDYVGVGEAPNDEVVSTFALGLAGQGNVRTKTLRAFTPEQFAGIVKRLP
jgi:uncharacterized protein with GYD domain